jgi:hypothetical protein
MRLRRVDTIMPRAFLAGNAMQDIARRNRYR